MKFTAKHPLVLASQSPRRNELLSHYGIPFEVLPSDKPEPSPDSYQTPLGYVLACAEQKAEDVAKRRKEALVIGADTIVVLDGDILLKPQDKRQATDYLSRLSGKTHEVITAVAVRQGASEMSFHERVKVRFYELPESWIDAYTDAEDPYDKAGAYGIQTVSGLFVQSIEGDYNAVVGLPVGQLLQHLVNAGYIQVEGAPSHVK